MEQRCCRCRLSSQVEQQHHQGKPWEHRGGILVGFLELGDGSHVAPQLLQRRVYARRHIFRFLHCQAVVD